MDHRGSGFLVLPPGSCPREVTEPPDGCVDYKNRLVLEPASREGLRKSPG